MSELEVYKNALCVISGHPSAAPTASTSREVAQRALAMFAPHPLEGLPVDTVVINKCGASSHFSKVVNGEARVFDGGRSSKTRLASTASQVTALAEGDWAYWDGGECPLPGWVKVVLWLEGADGSSVPSRADSYTWVHGLHCRADILGYQIVAQDVPAFTPSAVPDKV